MKVMNEKYQQALKDLKQLSLDVSFDLMIDETDNNRFKILEKRIIEYSNTLQELVDMMKPLEFEELEKDKIYYDNVLHKAILIVGIIKREELIWCEEEYEAIRYEPNRFYRNIWEVE